MVDNVGTIEMSRNNLRGTGTRHANTRFHFAKQSVCRGTLEVVFARSEENTLDIMSKNLIKNLFEKHSARLVEEVPEEWLNTTKQQNDEVKSMSLCDLLTMLGHLSKVRGDVKTLKFNNDCVSQCELHVSQKRKRKQTKTMCEKCA